MKVSLPILFILIAAVSAQAPGSGLCTYHPYESDQQRLGAAYDNSPPWCGMRYSALDTSRIVAVNGMHVGLCNRCLEVRPASGGAPVYVLAVDWKGAPGLDLSRSSFARLFPNDDPLNPQTCQWKIVSSSYCSGFCTGTEGECTPGIRNLLPAYLLDPITPNTNRLNPNSSGNKKPEKKSEPTSKNDSSVRDGAPSASDVRNSEPKSSPSPPKEDKKETSVENNSTGTTDEPEEAPPATATEETEVSKVEIVTESSSISSRSLFSISLLVAALLFA